MGMRISLCLIVWNELESCRLDVPRLPRDAFEEIFAVDGGSTDGTVEYLQSQGIVVYTQPHVGLNVAYVHANAMAHCEAVVVFFPKATTPVEDLRKFRPLFDEGYELIVASRQISGSVNEEDAGLWRPRKWSVLGLAVLAAILWRREGHWVRDVLHGFKGWSREAFTRMEILDHGLSIDVEMVVRAYKLRIKRAEFPSAEKSRNYGVTHFKFWPTGKKLLAYLWFEIKRGD
jgi:glycosyltransferase involved in cell wall biosynthesis